MIESVFGLVEQPPAPSGFRPGRVDLQLCQHFRTDDEIVQLAQQILQRLDRVDEAPVLLPGLSAGVERPEELRRIAQLLGFDPDLMTLLVVEAGEPLAAALEPSSSPVEKVAGEWQHRLVDTGRIGRSGSPATDGQ